MQMSPRLIDPVSISFLTPLDSQSSVFTRINWGAFCHQHHVLCMYASVSMLLLQ